MRFLFATSYSKQMKQKKKRMIWIDEEDQNRGRQ
jgi:hypothetical protein